MKVLIYVNVDENGNIVECIGGKGIVVNQSDYMYKFEINDSTILLELEKYKVVNESLVKGD